MRNIRLLSVFMALAVFIPVIAGCEPKGDSKAEETKPAESTTSDKKPAEVKPVLAEAPVNWPKEDKQMVPKDWTIPIYPQSKLYDVSQIQDGNLNKITGTNIIIKSEDTFKKVVDWYVSKVPVDHKPDKADMDSKMFLSTVAVGKYDYKIIINGDKKPVSIWLMRYDDHYETKRAEE